MCGARGTYNIGYGCTIINFRLVGHHTQSMGIFVVKEADFSGMPQGCQLHVPLPADLLNGVTISFAPISSVYKEHAQRASVPGSRLQTDSRPSSKSVAI